MNTMQLRVCTSATWRASRISKRDRQTAANQKFARTREQAQDRGQRGAPYGGCFWAWERSDPARRQVSGDHMGT